MITERLMSVIAMFIRWMSLRVNNLRLMTCLKLIASILIVSIFLKCIIDVDFTWDTWWYHLPWAARIWNIIPADSYQFDRLSEVRYQGFPLFAEFLQGFFWKIFHLVQAANLVCFFSFLIYLGFLKSYCKIPFYISLIAILAVPLVQTHITSCYVDLPANVSASILIMMIYLCFIQDNFFTRRNLLVIFLAAASAGNTKYQIIPIVALSLSLLLFRFIWLSYNQDPRIKPKRLLIILLSVVIASSLIFFVPLRNIALYGNPFYPVRTEILDKISSLTKPIFPGNSQINITEKPSLAQDKSPDTLKNSTRPKKWILSVLEIKKAIWSIDQWSKDKTLNRMGGFFGTYVIFHLLVLVYLLYRWRSRQVIVAAIFMVILSFFTAFMPLAYELRYYMYWMISLVSLNLYLIYNVDDLVAPNKIINKQHISLVCCVILIFVLVSTRAIFVRPRFYTLSKHIQGNVQGRVINKIGKNDRICLVNKTPDTFLYTAYFQPQLNYSYSVKAADSPEECGTYKILD
ncbi:MAG: hypothetical protein U7127_20240 [Phormidium sp.]